MKNKIPILSVYDENGNRLEIPAIVGRSAYQDAVHRGYQGSVDDWLKSLRGEKGDPGENYNLTEADKEEIAGMISGGGAAGNVLILVGGTSLNTLRIEFVSPPAGVSVDAAYELIGRGMFDVAVQIYSDDGNDLIGMGLLRGIPVDDIVSAIGEFWSDGNVSLVNVTLDIAAMTAAAEVMYTASGGTSVEIDDALTISGAAADAKAVGDKLSEVTEAIADLKESGTGGSGLTSDVKSALMAVVEHIGVWTDGNGQTYIDNLRKALYTAPILSISANYTQTKTVYQSDTLDVLRDDLIVVATYADGSYSVVTDYTLSGTLEVGKSVVTVAKDGVTDTFEVVVTASRIEATAISLNETALNLKSSAPVQLTATVLPENTTDTVVWSSSENAVATVSNEGIVTPVSDGSCVITATAGNVSAECAVSVALPMPGINIGNPYLMLDTTTAPHTCGKTEEELRGKWYKAEFTDWGNKLGYSNSPMNRVFLYPFSEGTHYIRLVGRSSSSTGVYFFAFTNSDIGTNPTTTLGRVGSDYTDATATLINTFDSDYNDQYGRCDLGEWEYVDGSGTTYGEAYVICYKLVVPANVCIYMTMNSISPGNCPGISVTFPDINKLYTIFDNDPSANITQIVG